MYYVVQTSSTLFLLLKYFACPLSVFTRLCTIFVYQIRMGNFGPRTRRSWKFEWFSFEVFPFAILEKYAMRRGKNTINSHTSRHVSFTIVIITCKSSLRAVSSYVMKNYVSSCIVLYIREKIYFSKKHTRKPF